MYSNPILVFGATGKQGGAVARYLREAGRPVRANVRDRSAPEAAALAGKGVELVEGALDDVTAIRDAMTGAGGVFSVLPGTLSAEDEVRFGCAIADLAATAGIAHFVYSSGASVGPTPTGIARLDAKPRIEAHVRSLPLAATIVRPMIFMEMMLRPGVGLAEGRMRSIMQPDLPVQLVAVADIGRFVAAILANRDRFAAKTLTLASDTVTGREMAAIVTTISGKSIAYERLPDAVLADNPDLAVMARSLVDGPLSRHADLDALRRINPAMASFRSWMATDGQAALARALARR